MCSYVADPATFLASISFLGPYFPLRIAGSVMEKINMSEFISSSLHHNASYRFCLGHPTAETSHSHVEDIYNNVHTRHAGSSVYKEVNSEHP